MDEVVVFGAVLMGIAVAFAPSLLGFFGWLSTRRRLTVLTERVAHLEQALAETWERTHAPVAPPVAAPVVERVPSVSPPPAAVEPVPEPVESSGRADAPVHVRDDADQEDEPVAARASDEDADPVDVRAPARASDGGADGVAGPDVSAAPTFTPLPRPKAAARKRITPERLMMLAMGGVGGITLLIGVVLALAVAIESGLLGPGLRVTAGLMMGLAAWAVGSQLEKRSPYGASALVGVGVGMLYANIFAAASWYELVPMPVAFIASLGVTAGALSFGLVRNQPLTAHLGAFGGLIAPIVLSSGNGSAGLLFSYLAVLTAGSVVAAQRRSWWSLTALMAVGDFLLLLVWAIDRGDADVISRLHVLVWPLVLAAPFFAAAWRAEPSKGDTKADAQDAFNLVAASGMPVVFAAGAVDAHGSELGVMAAMVVLAGLPGWALGRARRLPLPVMVAQGSWFLVTLVACVDLPTSGAGILAAALLTGIAVVSAVGWRQRDTAWAFDLWPWAVAVPIGVLWVQSDGALTLGVMPLLALPWLALLGWDSGVRVLHAALVASLILLVSVDLLPNDAPWAAFVVWWVLVVTTWSPLVVDGPPSWRVGAWAGTFVPVAALAAFCLLGDPWNPMPWALVGAHTILALTAWVQLRDVPIEGWLAGSLMVVGLSAASVALPLQLQTIWLTIAVSLSGAVLGLLTYRIANPVLVVFSVLAASVVAIRLLLNPASLSYGDASGWPLINWTLYTWGLPACFMAASAWGLARGRFGDNPQVRGAAGVLLVTALWLGFALINVEISHAFQADGPLELWADAFVPAMVRSLAWGGYGLLVLVLGMAQGRRLLRFVGFGFLVLGTAKVFAVDLWSLSGLARVVSVLGLGVSLLVATFLFERLVIRGAVRDDQA